MSVFVETLPICLLYILQPAFLLVTAPLLSGSFLTQISLS